MSRRPQPPAARLPQSGSGRPPAARLPAWEARLAAFVADNLRRPYRYGSFDCLLMPAAAVRAVTGKDHGRGHRGKYKNAAGAARYLRGLGFASPEELLDRLFDEKPVGFAQRGDLVLCRTDSGDNPGVCLGGFALAAGADGLIRVPRDRWLKAWAV